MPDDVFIQVRAIHALLEPVRLPTTLNHQRRPFLRLRVSWPRVLDIALVLTTGTVYALANLKAPDLTVGIVGLVVLVFFMVRLVLYRMEYLRQAGAADPEAHSALMERSARELTTAQRLQAFDVKALEYVLSEYDSQLEAVDRYANLWLGPARVGGVIGFAALLLGVYPALQKLTGAWALSLLALPFGLGLGGFLGVGSFDGRRRARALLARATALKRS